MILFDTPRRFTSSNPRLRRFTWTAHCSSTLVGEEGTAELLAFGRRIGLKPQWLQHRGGPKEHFDLFDGAISRVRAAGAQEVNAREWLRRCVYPKKATPWQEGQTYRLLDVVRFDGWLWKPRGATADRPGTTDAWRQIPGSQEETPCTPS